MIVVSHFGRRGIVLAVLLGVAALVGNAGCGEHECGLVGCANGLTVTFDGNYEAGATYTANVSGGTSGLDIAVELACAIEPAAPGGHRAVCTSALPHYEVANSTRLPQTDLTSVRIAVSKDGATLGAQTFQPTYVAREINGPGCGVCTSAAVSVTIP